MFVILYKLNTIMTKLSVNINKIATLRNARGGNVPDLLQVAKDIQKFGAHGITIHPRPDERHITYQDARDLTNVVYTEYNIEGNPQHNFIDLVIECKPNQVTLVPDAIGAITSNAGWDTIKHQDYLTEVIQEFQRNGIRTSIFVDANENMVEGAKKTGTNRIELYTESFAHQYSLGHKTAIEPFIKAAIKRRRARLVDEVLDGSLMSLRDQCIKLVAENIEHVEEVNVNQPFWNF